MSHHMKNRSWNLKGAFSEGFNICQPPAILGSANSDINKVTDKQKTRLTVKN